MGIQGLWRYLDNHNLSRHLGASSDRLEPEHLLLDMNSIMHKAYDSKRPTTSCTINAVLKSVRSFVTQFPPIKSLTLVFDGVAPTAKIPTQRERRRKTVVAAPTATLKGLELQQGQIVTGSLFVDACEEAVVHLIRKLVGCGVIHTVEPVYISSYHSPGEGDTKLFKRLHDLAATSLKNNTYDPDDTVVIVGSDCDLVLGCAACTPFHNLLLMSPVTQMLTDIGELFTHWMKKGGGDLCPLEMLPSLRIDFVFCIALAGGDHFNGLEDRAIEIWRRYRHLRLDGGFYRRPLVSNSSFSICWELLNQIVSRDRKALLASFVGSKNRRLREKAKLAKESESGGNGDVQSGVDLLKGALWSVAAYTEGRPPAMDAKFVTTNPKPASIRVACARGKQHVHVPRSDYQSLPPISVYLGAIGLKSLLPAPFDAIVSLPQHKNFSSLTSGTSILAHISQMIATVQNDGNQIAISDTLNRTDDDDLLDKAIVVAVEAATTNKASHTPDNNKVEVKQSNEGCQPIPQSNKSKKKEAQQKAILASIASAPSENYTVPDEIKPLLVLAPHNEWLSISLQGPVVPKPAAEVALHTPEAETSPPIDNSKHTRKVNSAKGPPPSKNSKNIKNNVCESRHEAPIHPMDEPSFVARAVEATAVTKVLIREAVITPQSAVSATTHQANFEDTLNTIDFRYPVGITRVRISSLLISPKPQTDARSKSSASGEPCPSTEGFACEEEGVMSSDDDVSE